MPDSSTSQPNGASSVVQAPSNVANAVPTTEEKPASDNSRTEIDSPEEPEFKEGGYGWVVVASIFLVNAHTWGLNSSYAVFLAYYLRSGTVAGGTPLSFAFVGGLSISFALLVSPLATVCIGKFGTRTTLMIGVVFETASFIGASFTSQIWHLLLSQGVAFGVGMGFLFTATVGLVPQWFTKRRSFANAMSTGGSGFGGLIYSLGTNAMIENLGLEWAFRVLAIIAFVVNGVCCFTLRDRNKAIGAVHVAFHMGIFKRFEFWLFVAWGFFSLLSYVIVVFSLADYSQTVGFTASQGSIVAAMFNLSQGVGRPLIGLVSDKVGRLNIAGLGTLVASLAAFFLWIFAGKYYAGVIIYALFGMFAGILWPTVAPVGAEVVGIQLLPAALSIYWLILVLPATFAEVIGLSLREPGINGYIDVQLFTAIMFLVAFISMWVLRSWKLLEMDLLALSKGEREAETRGPDGAAVAQEHAPRAARTKRGSSILTSYSKKFFTIEHV